MTAPANPASELSPLEDALCEALAARYRLGEPHWPWPRRSATTRALQRLSERGIVGFEHGPTGKTWRAWLTDTGQRTYLSGTYIAPALAELTALREENTVLRRLLSTPTAPSPSEGPR
ncbi:MULTISPECIES: hypothetical protein [unclassified Nocardia]|uniref:hypothetical protein n=1 Tax=unclassified Nocardia TaxID=2637762 RepID=UPI001CE44674|nr:MULTISPECIES: hypothetical protein [unclassified Nocardia]